MFLISLCDFYLETKTSHRFGTNIYTPMCWTSYWESNFPTCHQLFTLLPKPHIVQTSRVTFCSSLIIYVSLLCGAIASCHHPDGLLPQCHLSFLDTRWDTCFHPGAHHYLIKWRSCHNLLSAVIAILTWKLLGTILISSIPNFHSIWNTWDISAPPWIVTWFH